MSETSNCGFDNGCGCGCNDGCGCDNNNDWWIWIIIAIIVIWLIWGNDNGRWFGGNGCC